jgi:catechol 2,3-dioxygenase-like lactoylglutathione lyase family enzyme
MCSAPSSFGARRGGPIGSAQRNSDLCFQWSGPIADAITHLERCRVPIYAGPIERFGAKGSGTSVYFRDPDGSLLEFISYHRNDGDGT